MATVNVIFVQRKMFFVVTSRLAANCQVGVEGGVSLLSSIGKKLVDRNPHRNAAVAFRAFGGIHKFTAAPEAVLNDFAVNRVGHFGFGVGKYSKGPLVRQVITGVWFAGVKSQAVWYRCGTGVAGHIKSS